MPTYDADQFDPPAPVAKVELRHPVTGALISDVPMLLDTGSDVTLLPRDCIEQLGVMPVEDKVYEVEGFDKNRHQTGEGRSIRTGISGTKIRGAIFID